MADATTPQNDPMKGLTPEQHGALYMQIAAMRDAALLLRDLAPEDAVAVAAYALHEVAAMQPEEGTEFPAPIEAAVTAASFAVDHLTGTPYARPAEGTNPFARKGNDNETCASEASDDAAWTEGFVDALLKHSIQPPFGVLLTVEFVLHYVSRGPDLRVEDRAGENKLGLSPIPASPELRAIAGALLANYLQAMQAVTTDLPPPSP